MVFKEPLSGELLSYSERQRKVPWELKVGLRPRKNKGEVGEGEESSRKRSTLVKVGMRRIEKH